MAHNDDQGPCQCPDSIDLDGKRVDVIADIKRTLKTDMMELVEDRFDIPMDEKRWMASIDVNRFTHQLAEDIYLRLRDMSDN